MLSIRSQLLTLVTLVCMSSVTFAQFGTAVPALSRNGEDFNEHKLEVGFKITSNGTATGTVASFPIPQIWPEQTVQLIKKKFSPEVSGFKVVDVKGAMQAQVSILQLFNGQSAEAIFVFEIRRVGIRPPKDPQTLKPVSTRRLDRDLKKYLNPSPSIESGSPIITKLAKELSANKETVWDRTKSFYDFVHEKIRYENGPLKGAVAALEDGTGDCEEMTSLFIALCRANKIPARTVWVPGHCYPEFLVMTAQEKQIWVPVEMTNKYPFGQSPEYRPILQKGDSFKLLGSRLPQHYVKPEVKIRDYRGAIPPEVQWFPAQGKEPPGA
ncbi:MAG: transglutaminase [Blastopirellula sp.]|nr:MAG: transglutaminase [Blastopirellula sp.]